MTQREYEEKMNELNLAMNAELEPLRKELADITAKKTAALGELAQLKLRISEYGVAYQTVCCKMSEIKAKHNKIKYDLYTQRPPFVPQQPSNTEEL